MHTTTNTNTNTNSYHMQETALRCLSLYNHWLVALARRRRLTAPESAVVAAREIGR